MILVIDVGNTNITFGVYESKKLVTTFRMTSRTMRTSDEYGTEILAMLQNNQIDRRKVGGAIIASVVPKVMHALIGAVVRYLHTEPLIVGSGIKTGIKITSENPKEIGPDRIVDVVAAYEKYGGPVLVLDFGTATTYDLVTEDGRFGVGITAPGIRISAKALWEDTDKLAALARRELTMGFMSGASVQKMAKSIDDVMHRGRKNAERLVRTESSYFSNQGQMQSYQELGIEEYIFLGGGCEICQALNGQAFKLSEAEAGVNLPPIHPNCKCTTRAKPRIDMFALKDGANQLKDNPKFEEWKKRYVKEKAKEPAEPLTDAEQHAMNSYISSSSYVWNDKLRRGEKLTKQEEQSIKAMDSALQKMPKYEGTVKRSLSDFGILDVDEFVESYVPGELKIFNEYLSSSTEVYDDSFQIQYVIQSKNGRDIRKYNSTEKEILFERGASFIVTRVDGHTIYMEEL